MRSESPTVTRAEVDVKFADAATHAFIGLDGTVFRELEDRTWIGRRGGADGTVRYSRHYAHAGGIKLKPACELVDGAWRDVLTGEPWPDPVERAWA